MRLLFVACNESKMDELCDGLKSSFVVDTVTTGSEATCLSESLCYDSIIIASSLNDIGGIELCGVMRGLGIKSPIILISDNFESADRVASLNSGVDVVIQKPVSVEEVKAQINVLARRVGKDLVHCRDVIKSGRLSLNMNDRRVFVDGKEFPLRRKEYDLLEYLMLHCGRAVSKEEILEHVWESGLDTISNTVEVHIRNIRNKFEENFGTSLVKTYRGFGYEIET